MKYPLSLNSQKAMDLHDVNNGNQLTNSQSNTSVHDIGFSFEL